jgi:intracellular sulfur oxidation DsrE/DsrF family protein
MTLDTTPISDEILGAYVDNELDATDRAQLLERLSGNAELRGRACELWQLKQMVRGAYPPPPRRKLPAPRPASYVSRWPHALAASLLLLFGTLSGWFMHTRVDSERIADRVMASQIEAIRADGGRVVLHLFSDDPARMEAALRTAEQLADARDQSGRPFRVEFLVNGPGLHLLRAGGSPYAKQVTALHSNHDNLRLLACHEAMQRLRDRGFEVTLLPGVEEAVSAENQLATRLTQGWRYLQT